MKLILIAALITASSMFAFGGCASTGGDKRCMLLAIAYGEQDDLAGSWYEEAAIELLACGYENTGDPKMRGRDHSGFYNADK